MKKIIEFAEIEYLIIGAGVVGLSIAKSLTKKKKEVFILEKNRNFGLEKMCLVTVVSSMLVFTIIQNLLNQCYVSREKKII